MTPLQRLTPTERRVLRCQIKDTLAGEPSGYSEIYDIPGSAFCVHEPLFVRLQKTNGSFLPAKLHWFERGGSRFVVFTCPGKSRSPVRSWLQGSAVQLRRRARLRAATGHHLKEHYGVLWEIQAGRCYFTGDPLGQRFEDRAFAVDHLDPIAVRDFPFAGIPGTNWPVNLALVTPAVNSSKGGDDAQRFVDRIKREQADGIETFNLRPKAERAMIDRLRSKRFAAYMNQHSASSL